MADAGASVFTVLDTLGFTNYVIPFLLVWTALYAVLLKTKLIGEKVELNGIVAFAITYLFVAFGGGKMVAALLPSFLVLFLIILIILLFYRFIGASDESIVKVFSSPSIVLLIIIIMVIFTFSTLQDWLVLNDRIPAWQVNESGDLIVSERIGGEIIGNVTNGTKPHSIIYEGQEYELINGIYYKQGYEGASYALGQPEVIGAILILIILGVATAMIAWPKT